MNYAAAQSSASILGEDVLDEIVDYVMHVDQMVSNDSLRTASLCLADSIACAVSATDYPDARRLLGSHVPNTIVPLGARVVGTGAILDPVKAAFDTSLLIRWLDFSDTTTVGGHPSDNLGAILATADFCDRNANSSNGHLFVKDILVSLAASYEIHGRLAAANKFDDPAVGLDHVIVVKIASAALSAKLMRGDREQIRSAVASAWIDGHSLNLYRHLPNTTSRKGWAGGTASSRGTLMALNAMKGEKAPSLPLSAPTWGFSDVYLDGKPVALHHKLTTAILDNIIFKLVPVQRNASTAIEAAIMLHEWYVSRSDKVRKITIETQSEAIRRIVKSGPLPNPEARDHCLQYAVAVALINGKLSSEDYLDGVASNPQIDRLRDMMAVVENPEFTVGHYDPKTASCANAITLVTEDGEVSPRIEVLHPIGDRRRRSEAEPLLWKKFHQLTASKWSREKRERLAAKLLSFEDLCRTRASTFITEVCHD